jgi:hypothetical protein
MRALPMLLASASVLGALLVLQSALFFVAGRGQDALPVGPWTNLLALGLPVALALLAWRAARGAALVTLACAALSVAGFAASALSAVPAPPCPDTASCVAPEQPALVAAGRQAHLILLLATAAFGAIACGWARALPGRARWLPLAALLAGFLTVGFYPAAEARGWGDHLTAFNAGMSAVFSAAVVLLLAKAPVERAPAPSEAGVEPPI